jgi:hypothetical protein
MEQCWVWPITSWGTAHNFVYALRKDGNLYRWYTFRYHGGIGDILAGLLFGSIGGIAFFIPTLLLALFFWFLDFLTERARKTKGTSVKT